MQDTPASAPPTDLRRGHWGQALQDGALAGSLASVASAVGLLLLGRREAGSAAAPVNAVSHWVHGDEALRRDQPTWRHTCTGFAIHHGASLFWAVLHARLWCTRPQAAKPWPSAAAAAVTTAFACVTDLELTPHRFTPGFEHRLDRRGLAVVYGLFALGLFAGSLHAARRRALPGRQRACYP